MSVRMQFSVLWLFVATCCIPTMASATTLVRLSENQLIEYSTLIVRGRVVKTQSKWNRSRLAIVTQVTVHVDEELMKRSTPTKLIVRHYGGTVGKQTMGLSSGPRFKVGEEVVLFLHTSKHIPGEFLLTGWTQGVWKIDRTQGSFPEKTPAAYRALVAPLLGFPAAIKPVGTTHLGVKRFANRPVALFSKIQQWRHVYKTIQAKKKRPVLRLLHPKTKLKAPIRLQLKKPVQIRLIRPVPRR